jgi:hypothetical protein
MAFGSTMKSGKDGTFRCLDELLLTALVITTWSKRATIISKKSQGCHGALAVCGHLCRRDKFTWSQLEGLGVKKSNRTVLTFFTTIFGRNTVDHIPISSNGDFINVHVIAIIKGDTASSAVSRSLGKFGMFLLFIRAIVVLLFFCLGWLRRWFAGLAGWGRWGL